MAPRFKILISSMVPLLLTAACGNSAESDPSPGASEDQVTVVAGSWGGLTDEWTAAAFGGLLADTGIDIQQDPAPGQQVAKIQAQAGSGRMQWDMLTTHVGLDVTYLGKEGLLKEIPADLKPKLVEAMGAENVTDFGIVFGSVSPVLVCKPEAVEKCPQNPAEFFDVENYPGSRTLSGVSPLYAIMLAAMADGASKDDLFPIDLERAFAKLEELKPHIDAWWTSGDQSQQVFRNEQAAMGMIYNGRAFALIDEGMQLEVYWDGAILDPSYQVVLEGAENADAAFQAMEWLATNPEACVQYMTMSNYDCPNIEALANIPSDTAERVPSSPSHRSLMAEADLDWAVDNLDEMNRMWKEFLAG